MGSILSTPVTAQHLQRKASTHIQAGFAELQGWRDDHEDAHVIDPAWGGDSTNRGLFVVFDGHGGTSAADFGSVYLPLKMSAKKSLSDQEVIQYFIDCDEAYKQSPENKAGAAVCMVITERQPNGKYKVRFANAGDSRAILVSSNVELPGTLANRPIDEDLHKRRDSELSGHAEHLYGGGEGLNFVSDDLDCGVRLATIDHKPNLPSEKARIYAAGGFVSNDTPARLQGMLALSRMIGDFNYKQNPSLSHGDQMGSCIPEMFCTEAEEGDFVVLACDGIFDVLSNNELARQVRLRYMAQIDAGIAEPDLAKIASDIINLSLNRLDSKDNMSLMVIHLKGSSAPPKLEDELLVGEFPSISELAETNGGAERRTKKAYEDFFVKVGYFKNPNACQICRRYFKQMSSCPCKKAIYCDQVCQKQDWKTHRKACSAVKHSSKGSSPRTAAAPASAAVSAQR